MSFTTTALTNDRVIVSGEDKFGTVGKMVLCAAQYNILFAEDKLKAAKSAFNAEVEAFYAPLTNAAEKFERASEESGDPLDFVVVQEGVEATEGRPEIRERLNLDTKIIMLVAADETDRLIWVDETTLDLLAA